MGGTSPPLIGADLCVEAIVAIGMSRPSTPATPKPPPSMVCWDAHAFWLQGMLSVRYQTSTSPIILNGWSGVRYVAIFE